MSRRKTPSERLAIAQQAAERARRQTIHARLDVAAAVAAGHDWPSASTTAIRRLLDTCDLFEWDLDRAEELTRAVELQFGSGEKVSA